MKSQIKISIISLFTLCVMMFCTLSVFAEVIPAGSTKRAEYVFSVDEITDTVKQRKIGGVGGKTIQVLSSLTLTKGSDLSLTGWLATDGGFKGFQYAIDSEGWKDFENGQWSVFDRSDVNSSDFGFEKCGKIGFTLAVPMQGKTVDLHDVFIRAVTNDGEYCEFLVLLNIQYGNADRESGNSLNVALGKYFGDSYTVDQGNEVIKLASGGSAKLGDLYSLGEFKTARIKFKASENASGMITLSYKSAAGEKNYSANISDAEGGALSIGLGENSGRGALTVKYDGASGDTVMLTEVLLDYTEPPYYMETVNFMLSASKFDYFTGGNHVEAKSGSDDTVGDYAMLILSSETNDPFITFNVEKAVKTEYGKAINADYHKYLVIKTMSPESNGNALTSQLFLCAGGVTGARESSSTRISRVNDGKWHSYIVDLSAFDFWTGAIHDFRFDFLEGAVFSEGQFVGVSSIAFCTTMEEAERLAEGNFEKVYDESAHKRELMFCEKEASTVNTHINFFMPEDIDFFDGFSQTEPSIGKYGDLILSGNTEKITDPYVSFRIGRYLESRGLAQLNAADYKTAVLRVLPNEKCTGTMFELFYYTSDHGFAEGGYEVAATFSNTEEWQYLMFDFTDMPLWSGTVSGFRIDWANGGINGAEMAISDIWFFADLNAARDFVKENKPEETTVHEETTEALTEAETSADKTTEEQNTLGHGQAIETEPVTSEDTVLSSGTGCKSSVGCFILTAVLALIPIIKKGMLKKL